jgi:hypothetical protein
MTGRRGEGVYGRWRRYTRCVILTLSWLGIVLWCRIVPKSLTVESWIWSWLIDIWIAMVMYSLCSIGMLDFGLSICGSLLGELLLALFGIFLLTSSPPDRHAV